MKDHSCSWVIWSIAVIIALGLGIYAGHSVTQAIADTELMDAQAALETANASLAEANIELAFWQATLRRVVEGDQTKEPELNGKPMSEKDKKYFFGGHSGFSDIFTLPQKAGRVSKED